MFEPCIRLLALEQKARVLTSRFPTASAAVYYALSFEFIEMCFSGWEAAQTHPVWGLAALAFQARCQVGRHGTAQDDTRGQ